MKIRISTAVLVLCVAAAVQAAPFRSTMRTEQKFAIAPGGTFVLENPHGNIDIAGGNVSQVEATLTTIVTAKSEAALGEGRRGSNLIVGGDARTRIVRTVVARKTNDWAVAVHWSVRVPRNAHVHVVSTSSERVRVNDILGSVKVKNFRGNVVIGNVGGSAVVESVNGTIVYSTPHPGGNVLLSTVNGNVTATVAGDADFRWVAETGRGDIRTSMQQGLRGAFFGPRFQGTVNAPGGPTITTSTLMGDVHLLASGASAAKTQSLRQLPLTESPSSHAAQRTTASGPAVLRRGTVKGLFTYETKMGDVRIQEIQGDARIFTGAGVVQLGAVSGECNVRSHGGPLELGEISGVLTATTRVGDILVDSTRRGGTIATQGGTIRLLYTSGATTLTSGGGDIVVSQAAASVKAETSSGDVVIGIDRESKSEKVDAKTRKGNILLHVGSKFGADVDATIVTTDARADTIASELPGLSIRREQVAGKTVVRATGKINGGGQKVVLHATGGDIRISTQALAPTVVKPR